MLLKLANNQLCRVSLPRSINLIGDKWTDAATGKELTAEQTIEAKRQAKLFTQRLQNVGAYKQVKQADIMDMAVGKEPATPVTNVNTNAPQPISRPITTKPVTPPNINQPASAPVTKPVVPPTRQNTQQMRQQAQAWAKAKADAYYNKGMQRVVRGTPEANRKWMWENGFSVTDANGGQITPEMHRQMELAKLPTTVNKKRPEGNIYYTARVHKPGIINKRTRLPAYGTAKRKVRASGTWRDRNGGTVLTFGNVDPSTVRSFDTQVGAGRKTPYQSRYTYRAV